MATDGRQTLYEGAFGVRKLGDPAAMTLDTLFWIASMTKAVTAVAAMQMVEQGRIGLDQPLDAVVPKLANPQVLDGVDAAGQPRLRPARRPLTLHDLLTHTSGFVYEMWNREIGHYVKATGRPGAGSGLNVGLEQPLAFDPGERWEYGIGIDWAGKVVEALSGQGLGAYFAEHIFGPLGMVDTQFGTPDSDRLATIHRRDAAGVLQPSSSGRPAKPELESGGGGLYSTGPDYLKFLAILLQGGGTVLRPETVALMARNQIGDLEVGADADDGPGGFEPRRVLPRHGQAVGLQLPDQHRRRACRAQRRQPRLGRAAELLLLARPGPQRGRTRDDAGPALCRFRRADRAGRFRRRRLRGLAPGRLTRRPGTPGGLRVFIFAGGLPN